ncbi:MAG: hypothetical protein HY653_03505, partial [Acidobacteria bacterium]|nr:hypothetical protein [Acidobacteriota bacterium]
MNDTQFGRVLCLSAILMVAFAATASAEDGWVISDRLSIVLPSGAKFNLDLEDIDEAIQYGKRFDSQQSLFQHFAKLGYQKTIPGFIAVRDVFLVTDFIRVAAHSAAAQRRKETVDAHALQEKLHGRLDIVVLASVEHGYRGVKPVLKPVLS